MGGVRGEGAIWGWGGWGVGGVVNRIIVMDVIIHSLSTESTFLGGNGRGAGVGGRREVDMGGGGGQKLICG